MRKHQILCILGFALGLICWTSAIFWFVMLFIEPITIGTFLGALNLLGPYLMWINAREFGVLSQLPQEHPQIEVDGADLVGRKCWVRHEYNPVWQKRTVTRFDTTDPPYFWASELEGHGEVWWSEARLCVDGVDPNEEVTAPQTDRGEG